MPGVQVTLAVVIWKQGGTRGGMHEINWIQGMQVTLDILEVLGTMGIQEILGTIEILHTIKILETIELLRTIEI